jgi:hypothetical protein
MDLEKRAFIEFQLMSMGDSIVKIANMVMPEASTAMTAPVAAGAAKPKFNWKGFRSAALADLGPAAGSVMGAGVANGYGLGAIP